MHASGHMLEMAGGRDFTYGMEEGGEFEVPLKKTASYRESGHFSLYVP